MVHISIYMAGCAGARAVAGELRVVQEPSPLLDGSGGWIEADRDFTELGQLAGGHNGNRIGDPVQHVQSLLGGIERQAARAALVDRIHIRSLSAGLSHLNGGQYIAASAHLGYPV